MATDSKSTGRESDKFMLRLPDGMRDLISAAAGRAGRTMNAEVVARLRATFDRDELDQLLSLATAQRVRIEMLPADAKIEEVALERRFAPALQLKIEQVLDASPPIDHFHELVADSKDARTQAVMLDQIYELMAKQQGEMKALLKERDAKLTTKLSELYDKAVERGRKPKVFDGDTIEWKTYDVVVRGKPVKLKIGPYVNGERGDDFQVVELPDESGSSKKASK